MLDRASTCSISTRISSGIREMGHGGAGENSVGGGSPRIERCSKLLIKSETDFGSSATALLSPIGPLMLGFDE